MIDTVSSVEVMVEVERCVASTDGQNETESATLAADAERKDAWGEYQCCVR